jgi:DNA polymerase-3 subunit delta
MPFMSNRRMVLVADTNLLNITVPDKDVEGLIDYLKKPNERTCLVFVARKIDQKRKLTKALIKHAAVMTADRLTRDSLEKWIAKRLRMGGKSIDRSTMNALVEGLEYLGKDSKMNLDDVDNEVEKVMAYTGVRSQILPQDVALVLSRGMEQSIFRMLDHLGSGNLKESLEILDYLFESGEPAGRILYMMVRQLRIVYRAKLMKSKGSSAEQIATTIGLKPFMINNALRQGRNFSMEKLQRAYERCADVDEMLKSTKNEPKVLLEMLIFDLR